MIFLKKTKFNSLGEALKNPVNCRVLTLRFIEENLKFHGQSFEKLENLKELFIQGDLNIWNDDEFGLPNEIGNLTKIEKLELLNLPIIDFPQWILNLKRLKHLMIRGTELQIIPNSIGQLSELTTLRIENCPLKELPKNLKELKKLKILGLSDTMLTEINKDYLPTNLKEINLAGTVLYNISDELMGRHLK